MNALTTEALFNGALTIKQPQSGYRFTIDPVLLAHFARLDGRESVMDLGTGSGILPLVLCHRYPEITVWGIDIQQRLASLARDNIRENGLEKHVTIIHGDLTRKETLPAPGSMDHVISNPPYIAHGAGRMNPNDEKAVARHEIRVTLDQVIDTSFHLLKDSGSFSLVFPEHRTRELILKLEAAGFAPRTLRHVHPLSRGPAKRILVDAVKHSPTPLTVLPPLIIYKEPGAFSDEVKRMFR